MVAKKGESSQNISRTDVLCEGPVKGLKNGVSSIFLNDVASDDATLRAYEPVQSPTSGRITFDGSSATNTGITGATLPTNLRNDGRIPRKVTLINYKTSAVALSSITEIDGTTSLTCTASSGTPFTDDWNTDTQVATRKAYLIKEGVEIAGIFKRTSTSAGLFVFFGVSDVVNTTDSYTLQISHSFFLSSINSASSLTLLSAPQAGTYYFRIEAQQQGNNRNSFRTKIDGIQAQFRPGGRYQNPLDEIGGVGGSIAGTNSVSYELKVISSNNSLGVSPVPEDGSIGSTMESGLPDDSQDDVASEAVILSSTGSNGFNLSTAQLKEVDEVSIRINYPGGLQSMNNNKGRRDPAYARYLIQIRTTLNGVNSEWENAFPDAGPYVEHTGRTNAAYSFDHVLGLNQYRPFDSFNIRVIRLTRHIGLRVNETGHGDGVTDKEKWTLIAKSKIDQLGYVIKDRLVYPYTSLVSTSFSSKQYQQPPKMSYLMQGLLVKVPSTYTPRDYSADGIAKYEEFWDGTFKNELQYTDNPAWVFYDIVTNNRYGAGKWIRESDIDKYALYRIARYCDELVDDGANGTEPRFRANVFLTKATDVYKVLKDFASIFTGMLYWMDSNLVAVQDSPADPVYNFTKGNVIDGKFSYESSGLKTRPNQVVVTWNDPKSNFEPVPIIVEDREAIVRDKRILKEDAVAFGCTSEAQAIRYGRWKLWTAQKQTEIISFKSALNSLYIKPGDIINVQDADRNGVQYSGRVSSATSSSVTLDRSVTLHSGSTYTLSTLVTEAAAFYVGEDSVTVNGTTYYRGDRIPQAYVHNGSSYALVDLDTEERASNAFESASGSNLLAIVWKEYSYVQENTVTTSASTTNTLSVSSFEVTPAANTIWALKEVVDSLNVVGSYKEYKVLSINQDKSNEYTFSAVEHYNEKYGAVDNGYATSEIPTSIYIEREPRDGEEEMDPPSNLRVVLETDASQPGDEIRLEWDPSSSEFVESYEVIHNIQTIESPIRVGTTFVQFTGVPDDRITFEVRAVSTGGNYSRYISLQYTSLDPYNANIERMQYGIPKGIRSTSESGIVFRTEDNPDGTTETDSEGNVSVIQIERPYYVFLQDSPVVSSNGNLDEFVTLAENEQDISEMVNNEDHYVFKTGTSLSLYYYDESSIENLTFWRDVGAGYRARVFGAQTSTANPNTANTVMAGAWTSIGSCTLSGNVLTGSNFTTSLQLRDILSLTGGNVPGKITSMGSFVAGEEYIITSLENSDFTNIGAESNTVGLRFIATGTGTGGGLGTAKKVDQGAQVISIIDANTAILDRSLDIGTSSRTVYRAAYRPDYENDAAIARVKRTGGESDFEYSNFVQIDPNLGTPKSMLVNVNPSILTYDVTGTQTNVPSDGITAEVFATGFSTPEFFMELPGRSDPLEDDELNGTESTQYSSGETTDAFKKLFTLDSSGAVDYAASDLRAIFKVREKNDVSKEVTREILIPRRRDAASAVLELSNDNVTVFANTTNQDATISEECVLTVFRGNEDVTNKFDLSSSGAVAVGTGSNGDIEGSFGTGSDINKFTVSTLKQTFTSGSISFTATGKSIANGGSEEFDGITLPSKTMSISVSSAEGADAVVYRVEPSVTAVTYDIDSDTLTPATSTGIRFDAYKTVGTGAPATYSSGGFKIYLDTNTGTNTAYASSSAESYVDFTGYSSSNDLITVKLFRDSALTELVDTETVPIISSGTSGENAKFLRLKTDRQIFVKAKDGTIAPSTIEFTAEKINLASGTNVTWSSTADLYANPTDTSPITQSSFTGTTVYLKSSSVSSTTSISVTAQATENSVTYTDTESVERVDDGSDAITISLSNENVTLTASNSGVVPNDAYTGSGTEIIVREGSAVLDYDAVGETAGHWEVYSITVSPNSAITAGTASASSGTDERYAIISDASSMSNSSDEATITFNIRGKRLDGSDFSENKVQTFSKAKAGDAGQSTKFLRLKTDHQVFVKRKNGTIEPDAIKFTAEKSNITGSPSWQTTPSSIDLFSSESGGSAINKNTFTGDVVYLRKASASSNTSISVTATLVENSVTYTDTESVERVDEGSDAITVSLSNDNVTFTADNSGTVSSGAYTGSGTTITVREGSNLLDYDASGTNAGTWTVATPSVNPSGGITVGSISESGDLAVVADASNMSSSDDNVAVTYTVSGKRADGTPFSEDKVQTFSKSEAGDNGDPGGAGDPAIQVSATNLTHTFIAGTNGIVSNNNFSCSFNLSQGGTAFTYAGSGTTANTFGITISSATNCSVTNTNGALTIDATSDILDTASVTNASFVVTLFDRGNSNATIASYTINLSKINQALRDGGTFTFTGYNGTYAAAWAGTLTTAAAQAVAQSVINNSSDGFITPNDKITVSGTLSGTTYAATRIYTGARTNASSSVGTGSFSSVVTEIFDGSVIVNGTLSAETLSADTTITNNIRVGERLQIGSPNDDSNYNATTAAAGIIHSVKKSTFTDTDAGFYLDGAGNVLIGNSTNFFKFDASTGNFNLQGNVTIQGPGGLSASLTRENAQAPSDSDGSNPVLTNTATTFKVFVGDTEVSLQKNTDSNPTADFLISRSKSPDNNNWQYNISSDGATITPTVLNADEATVTFTATPRSGGDYADYPSISKTYTITKVPEGAAITGDDGDSLDIIFKRSSTQPSTPSPSASTPSGWVTDVSSATGTDLLWASVGTKASGATNYTWQTPYQVEGTAVAEVAAYRLNNSTRSDTGSYNFTTSTLTPPTSWSIGPPSITNDGDIVYVIVGTASGSPTATAASITWSSAAVYARQNNGDPGDPGSAFFQITSDDNTVPASKITATKINSAIGRNFAVTGDICIVTASNGSTSAAYKYSDNDGDSSTYSTSNWSAATAFINGDLVVNGGITAEKLSLGQGGLTGSIMKLYEDGIDIYNSGNLRVRIGNLNPGTRN